MHERSLHGDFLLVILRDLRLIRPELRIVLMSATINANLFAIAPPASFTAAKAATHWGCAGFNDEQSHSFRWPLRAAFLVTENL